MHRILAWPYLQLETHVDKIGKDVNVCRSAAALPSGHPHDWKPWLPPQSAANRTGHPHDWKAWLLLLHSGKALLSSP